MSIKKISVLGSTGSIGVSTLELVAQFPQCYEVVALAAGRRLELLARQVEQFRPQVVSVANAEDVPLLRRLLPNFHGEITAGTEGAVACATHSDAAIVVSAIVGAAGLVPTLAAIRAGKDIALANKETLVTAGALMMDAVRDAGVQLLPVDSEHSAIFQALTGHRRQDVRKLILTASGGPFRDFTPQQLQHVTLEQALAHPNWSMGDKITIDSATMMNKGLEVIEAHWLFKVDAAQIDVHVHPQSIVHSMVEYVDGSVIAQLGVPDMKTPIAYALAWPERLPLPLPPLDLCAAGDLTFSRPDVARFPCLQLAYDALDAGGSAPVVLNAVNEVAVDYFLRKKIHFLDIATTIRQVLQRHQVAAIHSIDEVLEYDRLARIRAHEYLGQKA